MKKTKILVPAVAVLALGMAASVTGTVAWYAANIEVTGSGMQINCATSKNLVIANSSKSGWAASASATNSTTTTLSPVSTTDMNDPAKYLKVSDASKVDYNTGHIKNGGEIVKAFADEYQLAENGNNGYVRKDTFWVMLDAPASETINLRIKTIEVTRHSPNSLISKALRFGMITTTESTGTKHMLDNIYCPFGNTANVTVDALAATGTVNNQIADMSVTEYATAATDGTALTAAVEAAYKLPTHGTALNDTPYVLVDGFKGGDQLKLEMYFWLEGTDDNCISANSVNVDDIDIAIVFDYPNAQNNG